MTLATSRKAKRRKTIWRAATVRAPHPRLDATRADCIAPDCAVAGLNSVLGGLTVHRGAHRIGLAEPPLPIDQRTHRHQLASDDVPDTACERLCRPRRIIRPTRTRGRFAAAGRAGAYPAH